MKNLYLTEPQLQSELNRCLQCAAKPCQKACPAHVAPCDFIKAAKNGEWTAAAALIERQNPLGEVCGLVCPDKFCEKACVRGKIDSSIKIPAVQAEIMRRARENAVFEQCESASEGPQIAIIGSGPAGAGAAATLLSAGAHVTVFEQNAQVGGALNLIPAARLPREIVAWEWQKLAHSGRLEMHFNRKISDYAALLADFAGVIVAVGEQQPRTLGIEGEAAALPYTEYLQTPEKYAGAAKVAIIGGGAAAVDCAVTARRQGATLVEMFVRRRLSDMRITAAERQALQEHAITVTALTRPVKITPDDLTLYVTQTQFNAAGQLENVPNSITVRPEFDLIITALGSTRAEEIKETAQIVYAGDVINGGSTVVEAVASGKAAAAKLLTQI